MKTKQEKNIRTLIVCFVLLVFGLVPLRFLEVKNMTSINADTQVLGETSDVVIEKVEEVQIVLPNADIDLSVDEAI